jgi:dolichol-phosphate mannosyltransferase
MCESAPSRAAALSFCVIVPMYNEERGAENCVRRICETLQSLPWRSDLIVVEDGSLDRTRAILAELEPAFGRLKVVRQCRNAGYGAALRAGVERAVRDGYEYALFMDSDLTNDPADIPRFVEKMEQGIDLIKASRYVRNGGMQGVPWKRRVVSRAGNLVARYLMGMGLHDCTNGFRAVKLSVLSRMALAENGFPIVMEELYYCRFLVRSWCEIPVLLTNRGAGQRATSFSYTPAMFGKYLRFALKARLGIRPMLREGDRI